MRGPGYAEAGDLAAHQGRQWARAIGYAFALCLVLGFGAGAASLFSSFGPAQRDVLVPYAVTAGVAMVSPDAVLAASRVGACFAIQNPVARFRFATS